MLQGRLVEAQKSVKRVNELLFKALRTHAHDRQARARSIGLYARALHATLMLHGANACTAFLLMPAVHIPVFIVFALSIRELCDVAPDFDAGGALWFVDLSQSDETWVLP